MNSTTTIQVQRSLHASAQGRVRLATLGVAVAAALTLGAYGHAAADSLPSSEAAAFHWAVQLPRGLSMAGDSADLPSAIQLAEVGETLNDDERQVIISTLTTEAQDEGASLTATAPPEVATPAPVATPTDLGDDGE